MLSWGSQRINSISDSAPVSGYFLFIVLTNEAVKLGSYEHCYGEIALGTHACHHIAVTQNMDCPDTS